MPGPPSRQTATQTSRFSIASMLDLGLVDSAAYVADLVARATLQLDLIVTEAHVVSRETYGTCTLPFGLELADDTFFAGDLESSEISEGRNTLLFSLKAHATLEIVSGAKQGSAFLKVCKICLGTYKIPGSELIAICIVLFGPNYFPNDTSRRERCWRKNEPRLKETKQPSKSSL